MTNITVALDDAKAKALQAKAERHSLKPGQLVMATVEDLLRQSDVGFDAVAQRILKKNAELYRRLA